jgi:hypothetical protein
LDNQVLRIRVEIKLKAEGEDGEDDADENNEISDIVSFFWFYF